MKEIKIQSGTFMVRARMQFQVSTKLRLRASWLEQELRAALDIASHKNSQTIEVKSRDTVHQSYHYQITFAPCVKGWISGQETALSVDEVVAELVKIEEKVRAAMRTRHLLSALVEKTPRPEPPRPRNVVPQRPRPDVI